MSDFSGNDARALYNMAEVLLVSGERALASGEKKQAVEMWREAEGLLARLVALDPSHQRAASRLQQVRSRLQ